ncbi:MAG: HAMP domain-containing sensor histidine kinase, partial [Candidatus Solibacter sp.]|nr:HAMP domain-containing sensor histidine kinase [Candidatus Solibacter sp.]
RRPDPFAEHAIGVSRMRILMTFGVTVGLTVALAWFPMPGPWWHAGRWVVCLAVLSMSAKHGPLAGLFTGLAASLLWAFAMDSRGMGDMAWLSLLLPDFAGLGLLGGRLLGVWPRFKQRYDPSEVAAWPESRRFSEAEIDLSLSPISSIQSAAYLLAEDDTPADLRHELAGIISKECGRLSTGITGLIQRGATVAEPQFREANLGSIIDSAVREAEFVLCARGIVVRREIAPGLPAIQCNPDQLRSLVRSLTINAVHSAPVGDEVVLNARTGEDGIILEVRDQGKGSSVGRVLGRFFSSRPETKGVGLAAASEIVRQHGGRIEAKVNDRKGFEFSVWLPLRRDCVNGDWQGAGGGGR